MIHKKTRSCKRDICVVCRHPHFEEVSRLDRFPVFMSATSNPPGRDDFAEMVWVACKGCQTVQLASVPPIEAVYPHPHSEGIGSVWEQHEQRFRAFIALHSVPPIERIARLPLTGRDLAQPVFPASIAGTLVHSHVMEHWREPLTVLKKLAETRPIGCRLVFSIPAMDELLALGLPAVLNFEHTFHLSRHAVEALMLQAGFSILAAENYGNHSIFLACERSNVTASVRPKPQVSGVKLVREAFGTQRRDAVEITRAIRQFDGAVYLFGAHIFSQYLLNLGLNESLVDGVLDNSKEKHGKRLYGTALPVLHPTAVQSSRPSLFIVRTGSYDEEIKHGLRGIFGANAVFC